VALVAALIAPAQQGQILFLIALQPVVAVTALLAEVVLAEAMAALGGQVENPKQVVQA
jgi:hypothetical protein